MAALVGLATTFGETQGTQYRFDNVRLNHYDALMVVVAPPPSNLQVDVQQVVGKRHVLVIMTNESGIVADGGSRLPSPFSVVQLGVEGERYNITIRFTSQGSLWLYYGALTLYPTTNYPGEPYYRYGNAYFVAFSPVVSIPPGNTTVSMLVQFAAESSDSNGGLPFLPQIILPPIANLALFVMITLLVSYVESFFLLSSYFRNKTKGLSNTRKAIAVVSVLVAAAIVIWFFNTLVS